MERLHARAARIAAGLSLAEAAQAAEVTVGYLRRCESANAFPMILAERLAQRYGCSLMEFTSLGRAGDGTRPAAGTEREPSRPRASRAGRRG